MDEHAADHLSDDPEFARLERALGDFGQRVCPGVDETVRQARARRRRLRFEPLLGGYWAAVFVALFAYDGAPVLALAVGAWAGLRAFADFRHRAAELAGLATDVDLIAFERDNARERIDSLRGSVLLLVVLAAVAATVSVWSVRPLMWITLATLVLGGAAFDRFVLLPLYERRWRDAGGPDAKRQPLGWVVHAVVVGLLPLVPILLVVGLLRAGVDAVVGRTRGGAE
jgi:hypothetical protein